MTQINQRLTRTVELRNASVNNENGEMILEGYAAIYDSPTVVEEYCGIEYKEIIAKNAFDGAIMKDCCLKYNHNDSAMILARTRGGSLELTIDNVGLKFRAKLFNTSCAKDVYTLIKEGGIDKCSFAFRCAEDSYNVDTQVRTILKIKELFDVSVVDIPAYDNTSVEARSFFKLESEKRQALDRAKLANKLKVLTYL